MSVLVYIDHAGGNIKKVSLEALSYATKVAELTGAAGVTALVLGSAADATVAGLGAYGATHVLWANNPLFDNFDSGAFTKAIAEAVAQTSATLLVLSHNSRGKAIAPRLSVRLKAPLIAGAVTLPTLDGSALVVRKSVFSGKAFADCVLAGATNIISLNPNAYSVVKGGGSCSVSAFSPSVSAADFKITTVSVEKQSGDAVPLPEAELVVSAGRGMRGPENWYLVEDLATALGATTACSRPVADVHWRPHHEHVGQTGITIRPNLYIAIGISGAIQHLAGVNNSKVIVVINKDSEAPFFKAADYGIVGDAFEILPKLTEAVKRFKAEHA
jgi:electron transfer flavoprotein alpha subunit